MRVFERVIESLGAPGKHDLWIKRVDGGYSILINENDKWVPVSGSGGGAGSLIVHGQMSVEDNNMIFVPNNGQPTFSEAAQAFDNGIPVILEGSLDGSGISSGVLCHTQGNGFTFLGAFFGEGYIFWRHVDNK